MTDTHLSKPIGKALVVSEDAVITKQLSDAMEELALSVEVCGKIADALDRVNHTKLEVAVIDLSLGNQAILFLERVRASASNRTAITFAVTNNSAQTAAALKGGSAFTLQKPLTIEAIRHTFKAAYGLIVRERRRYFRYPISVPAAGTRKGESEIFGKTINISEKGMALSTSTPLAPGTELKIQFTLPDPRLDLTADCKVCWNNDKGQAGLLFVFIASNLASDLQSWLARRLEEQLPDVVTQRFQS
ncbi:MAG: PilZ domain-containing protein [Terriglobales bacterium]|jgi:ActR/RegA family two-component response regulator